MYPRNYVKGMVHFTASVDVNDQLSSLGVSNLCFKNKPAVTSVARKLWKVEKPPSLHLCAFKCTRKVSSNSFVKNWHYTNFTLSDLILHGGNEGDRLYAPTVPLKCYSTNILQLPHIGCPLLRRKCLGTLALSKKKHTDLGAALWPILCLYLAISVS